MSINDNALYSMTEKFLRPPPLATIKNYLVKTVSITCTSPNSVLTFDTFTLDTPDCENTFILFVSGSFTIVTNSPPRVCN